MRRWSRSTRGAAQVVLLTDVYIGFERKWCAPSATNCRRVRGCLSWAMGTRLSSLR